MTPPDPNPNFPLGVASFDPLVDRVLLWTCLTEPAPCRWEVATDATFSHVVEQGEVEASAETGVVTVDVTGLEPATRYWYRFETADGASSTVGRTRTLPGDGADRFRLAAVCCARFGQSEFGVYGAVAGADVDLVVHLGDYVYEDAKWELEGREPEPDHHCVTLDDYRTRHAQARRDPDLQALHAAHPMAVVWDDHDLADNAWRGGAKGHDPDTQGPWAERLDAALRAHQEFLPKRLADPDDLSSAWRRLDGGDLFTVVCTEGRAQRDEQAGHEGSTDADHPDRTMLGSTQARWLEEAVSGYPGRWVVLLTGTVLSELVIPAPDALDGALPEKYAVVDGCAANTDQWDGYLAERRRLAAALARRNGGSLALSGDIHSSWAIEGPLGPDGVPVAVELVCPPAATTPLGQLLGPGIGEVAAPVIVDQLPGVRWVDLDHRGYLTVHLGRERADATWWWVEGRRPEPGRRWSVPQVAPMGLVDPEARPAPTEPQGPGAPSPRRWAGRLAVAGLGAAVGIALDRWVRRRT